jgi:uncharacterized protein YcbK (DUF882 family)
MRMSAGRTTVLLLVPGRSTLSLELDARWPFALVALLAMPLMMGVAARQCLDHRQGAGLHGFALAELTGSLQALQSPQAPAPFERVVAQRGLAHDVAPAFVSVSRSHSGPASARGLHGADVVNAQLVRRVLSPLRGMMPATIEPASSWLRLQSLHLGESVRVRPFDENGSANPEAFDALRHLMRCRITGDEIAIDPRLVRILVQINATYNRPIQLVSGHRTPNVIGTRETSQHTLGKAADIKVAGVGIEELRAVALKLGARGVGLYPEKGFVHVDVRDKAKYTWMYTAAAGEEADMR